MASSPAPSDASHESDPESQNAGKDKNGTSIKDKECPYCHQKFTSSSLGRHLDQFISKKKPDGIHIVEEIKRLRAGITRRTARGGKRGDSEHQDSHEQSAQASPTHLSDDRPTPAFLESLNRSQAGTNDVHFNRMGWQSTGVITDPLPPSATTASAASPSLPTPITTNAVAGSKRSFSTYAADLPAASTHETTRALELALREVLDAVNVATKRTAPLPQPFPFELTSQTFPSLCLLLLPTPATLFQPSPFSTNTTIPLEPPGVEQLYILRQKIKATLDQWKWDALAYVQRNQVADTINVGEEAQRLAEATHRRIEEGLRHLELVYQNFVANTRERQYQLWSIELLRAYKSEQDQLKEANERIARITQEASQLQQQIDYLSRCQWPREMALWPPERNTFSSTTQKALQDCKRVGHTSLDTVQSYGTTSSFENTTTLSEDGWDFEKLVNKWKRHIREDRARRGGGVGSMLPPPPGDHDAVRMYSPSINSRKSISASDLTALGSHSGTHRNTSQTDSSTVRNGPHLPSASLGITDKPITFVNTLNQSLHRPSTGTPSNHSLPSHTQTPPVQIISDVHDHMARFAPWLKQKALEEREERMAVGD